MNIITNIEGKEMTVNISGRLDTITAPELEKVLSDDLCGVKELVFDLKDLEYLSSAGLRVLLGAQKKMNSCGSMKLRNVNDIVMDIFRVTGFADIFTIE